MRTTGKKLIVEIVKKEKVGSLYMPDTAEDRNVTARVLECGPRVRGIEQGEVVQFSRMSGTELNKGTYVIEENDVLVIL